MKKLILTFICLLFAIPSQAATITVDDDGPADFNNIQTAINAATTGDTVLVADGTYTGTGNRDIDFLGKAITVRSESGPENCIIDCNGTYGDEHRGFYFNSGEDTNSVLSGLTITGGYTYKGGGIYCNSSSPTVKNCIITDNVCGYGGGIACEDGSDATINNCAIIGNIGDDAGGGIYCRQSNITVKNCTIIGNIVDDRDGGGIFCYGSDITITNCTFADNSAPRGNFLACGYTSGIRSSVWISNCIIWAGGGEIQNNDGSRITISYSNVRCVYVGEGNIDADPCFVESGFWDANGTPDDIWDDFWVSGDYHLLSFSPCIDTGDPNYIPEPNETDLDGNPRISGARIDMGAYETNYIEAEMNFTPKTLNCNSRGNWVKAHLTLPDEFLPEDVDVNTPAWAEPLDLESEYIKLLGGSPVKLEIAFDRQDFCAQIAEPGQLEVTIIGSLTTGQHFFATDSIKIILPR